jgi:long-subunit fatty acid transport protein
MKKIICIIVFMASLSQAGLFGSLSKSGTTASQFLKIPVGARAIGMGGAYVALANDASAVFWNPGGLANISGSGAVSFIHTNWLAETSFNFAVAVINIEDFGALGISFTSLSMPDMEVRDEFNPEGTGEYFSAGDLALGLSYARKFTDRFSLGFTAKYVYQKIWHMTASTIAFDVGMKFQTDLDWLVLGISISNFGPKIHYTGKDVFINYDYNPDEWGDSQNIFANLQTDEWELPLMFRVGLAFKVVESENHQLVSSVEARHPNDNTENISAGLEYGFLNKFFLRAGYQSFFEENSEKGLTAGAGFVYFLSPTSPLKLDYAYADWNRLTQVHRFSIEIQF